MPAPVYLETSHAAQTNARTGIQNVVRGLVAGLASRDCPLQPVRWSFKKQSLTPLKQIWERNLGLPGDKSWWLPPASLLRPRFWPVWKNSGGLNYKTPIHQHPSHREKLLSAWLILPELMEGSHVRLVTAYARQHGMRVAGIFHDAIAWFHPEVVVHWTPAQHREYMTAFAELDVVIAVSDQAGRDFLSFVESQNLPDPPLKVCRLAAQIPGQPRETQLRESTDGTVRILCVSTLEPRKNHLRVIAAFQQAFSRVSAPKAELHLVGAEYVGSPEIAGAVQEIAQKNPAIIWHGKIEDGELRRLYSDCDFTVFGSWIEGFGLPVVESLWFGKPCLCSDQGVIAENGEGGGCLLVETRSVEALANGMRRLADESEFRRELARQALTRKLKTWDDYAGEVLGVLRER